MVPVMVVGMLFGNTSLNNQAPIASSAAIDETVIIKNIGTSEYRGIVSHDEFIRVIGRTDWPSELWPYVWMVSRCEATGPTDDTINQGLIGDGDCRHHWWHGGDRLRLHGVLLDGHHQRRVDVGDGPHRGQGRHQYRARRDDHGDAVLTEWCLPDPCWYLGNRHHHQR